MRSSGEEEHEVKQQVNTAVDTTMKFFISHEITRVKQGRKDEFSCQKAFFVS